MSTFDGVIIAGAGPVGMSAAVALAQREVPVLVLERGEQLSGMSRASTFHPPTLEMLETLGVVDELMRIGLRVDHYQFRDRQAGVIAEFDYGVLVDDTRYPFRIQCEQSKLTPILLDRLNEFPSAQIKFGHRLRTVSQSADAVEVAVENASGMQTIRGRYLLGTDGAHSVVRDALDIEFDGMTYPERYLVITTQHPLEHALPGLRLVNYVFDPEEWLAILRTPDAWRVLMPVAAEAVEAGPPARSFVVERLKGVAPDIDADQHLEWSVYEVHQRLAATFRKDRVLLLGDAAHINSPLGGMGMNSGIHDAMCLAPRLANAVHTGDEAGLDDYADMRRRVAIDFVKADTHRNAENFALKDPAARAGRDADLRAASQDPARAREFLLRSSMLASLTLIKPASV
jgi:2-polyprenyl-6-methoxyphenol hydroxylase-like FAD-dependent oxidoreductase